MPCSLLLQHVKKGATLALICLLTGLLAACAGNGPQVRITFWSWVPGLQTAVDQFNRTHPDIHVDLQNFGVGDAEYHQLTKALASNSGAPDVAQIEYTFLPQYEYSHSLIDLSPYGANALKNDFVPWAWGQVSQGGKVYAIPQDSGPMGLIYRADIFTKYHLPVPTSWGQYMDEAQQLYEAQQLHPTDPKITMTNFDTNDCTWFIALTWQAGSQPFQIKGKNLTIHLDDPAALKVADYWGTLVKEKLVSTALYRSADWYSGLDAGTIASWVSAAWGPTQMKQYINKSYGQWRVALLPQWTTSSGVQPSSVQSVSANWGGSTDAVTIQSKYQAQAAEFVEWLNTDPTSLTKLRDLSLFPTQLSELSDPAFNAPNPFFGGQKVNQLFEQSSQRVDISSFQWSPFESVVVNVLQSQLVLAVKGQISFEQALHNTQDLVVSYARSQRFLVNE